MPRGMRFFLRGRLLLVASIVVAGAIAVSVSVGPGCQRRSGGTEILVLPRPVSLVARTGFLRLDRGTRFRLTMPDSVWTGYPTAQPAPTPLRALYATGIAGLLGEIAGRGGLALGVAPEIGDGWRLAWGKAPKITPPEGREAYRLAIDARGLALAARDASGLFYGIQTLRQLLQAGPPRFPAVTIEDAPAYPHRGVLIDISRGRVPTLAALRDIVDGIAEAKMNVLMLYIEFAYAFPSHPDIGREMGQLTPEEARELVEYARPRHVEVVPALQTLGHSAYLLHLPAYRHLAAHPEDPARRLLNPAVDGTYELLDGLVGDLLRVFDAPHFNICADEATDPAPGLGGASGLVIPAGPYYVRHVTMLDRTLRAAGRRTLLFADMLRDRPEVLPYLPRDAVLLNWNYLDTGPLDRNRYPLISEIAGSGREQWVCPAIMDWGRIYPDLPLAVENIAGFADDGRAHGATGLLTTSWGERGGDDLLAGYWYGFLYAADLAWNPHDVTRKSSRADFQRRFAWQRYRLRDTAIAEAMWAMGESNEPFRFWWGHNLSRNLDFYYRKEEAESIVASIYSPERRRLKAAAVGAAVARARAALDRVPPAPAGWQVRLAGERDWVLLAAQRTELAAEIATLLAGGEVSPMAAADRWRAVAGRYPELLAQFRELWLREARPESFGPELIEANYAAAVERCRADAARQLTAASERGR